MNLKQFINNFLNESGLEKKAYKTTFSGKSSVDEERLQRLVDILSNKTKFEGDIDSVDDIQKIIDSIKQFKKDLSDKSVDKSDKTHTMKNRLAKMSDKADDIQKIIDKIKNNKKISYKEEDAVEEFSDKIEDILFSETYVKTFTSYEEGSSGGKANIIIFNESFPIEYTDVEGVKYYGLIRPPSGIVTWSSDEVREKVGTAIPKKFALTSVDKDYKIERNKENYDLVSTGKIKVLDTKDVKEKIVSFLELEGASINEKGDFNGINKALNRVSFWGNVKKLFQ